MNCVSCNYNHSRKLHPSCSGKLEVKKTSFVCLTLKTAVIFFVIDFLPLLLMGQSIFTTGKAYRNPADYALDSALVESTFALDKNNSNSKTEGYLIRDLGNTLSYEDLKYSVWLISDGNYLYFNSTRHGFKNRYKRFKKNGNYYFFSAQPVFDVHQRERMITSYTFNGWLGVACTYRRMSYQNEKKRDNVLDLEKGTTSPLSADHIYNIIKEYPALKNEFIKDTTEISLDRLLYFLDKVNEEWKATKKESRDYY